MAYIYKITNNINGKVYIGETTRTVQIRWNQHKTRARNTQFTEYLYNAMRKYGIENFSAEEVTVNEQNPKAKGCYEHLGFKTYKTSATDEQGNPYPIAWMRL